MSEAKTHDVAVIGAGAFGSWSAYFLRRAGLRVLLLDAYGPANARASSGGESRIIRTGYGADEIYTRSSLRALPLWKEIFARASQPSLFHETGVLWIAQENEKYSLDTVATLQRTGVKFEKLSTVNLRNHFPQFTIDDGEWGIYEPESGVLLARRAVQLVVEQAQKDGVDYREESALPPNGHGRIASLKTSSGADISAGTFVFACGPWLPKIFPSLLGSRIFPTRQEVLFFGIPARERWFLAPAMPTWIIEKDLFYGMPDIESRGFKIAHDLHGPAADPDTQSRIVTPEAVTTAQKFLARRFPALKDAPVVETRVCQYENTSNGDFLIDRLPDFENVWIAGGGSGHGFKHGPSVGVYVAAQITKGGPAEPRYSLASKQTTQKRAVY
ncbi:MAG TPA: FAD-dependent oxidoreductase [Candidatus Limnocylindrales bacterium]|nr:FAD-dependent oxidoreductase [Candidatus Limnocylindrales bacterium]